MPFERLAQHVKSLGGVCRIDGAPLRGLDQAQLAEVSELMDAPLPPAWQWWLSSYGVGIKFVEPVVYDDAVSGTDVMMGHFVTVDEMRQTIDDFEGSLARHRVPFNDDASGNFLVIDSRGAVSWHIHDAPTDRNTKRVADTFDAFLLMFRRGE